MESIREEKMSTEKYQLSGELQTVAFRNSRDMLNKLGREIDGLRKEPGYPGWHEVADRTFNCAVTVWSIADWLWVELGDNQKAQFDNNVARFRSDCAKSTPDLETCESLSSASRHRQREPQWFNKKVVANTVARRTYFSVNDPIRQPLAKWKWETIIVNDGVEHKAVDVFDRAYADWCKLIDRYASS
jgi:hypothetical protein